MCRTCIVLRVILAVLVATMLGLLWTGAIAVRTVLSGSMEPTIPTGAVVVTRAEAAYAAGDVITFRDGAEANVPTTHRIVEVLTTGDTISYVTRGDANETNDFVSVPHMRVLGKVIAYVPFVGYILDFVKRPLGLLLVVGIPAVVLITSETYKLITRARTNKTQSQEIPDND